MIAGPVLAGVGYRLIRPAAHGFHVITDLLPGMIVLATGTVLTSTPLTSLNLSSVEPEHGGIASAVRNAAGRLSALIATALCGADRGQCADRYQLRSAAAGLCSVVLHRVAALCRDRHDAHPHLRHAHATAAL